MYTEKHRNRYKKSKLEVTETVFTESCFVSQTTLLRPKRTKMFFVLGGIWVTNHYVTVMSSVVSWRFLLKTKVDTYF